MKSLTKSLLVGSGTTALLIAGTVSAFADWTTETPLSVLEVKVAEMPRGRTPIATASGNDAALSWDASMIAGTPAERYIVTRVGAAQQTVVCAKVAATGCRDRDVPDGAWTWRVRPLVGTWEGTDSPDSRSLTFGAAKAATPTQPAAGQAPPSPPKTSTAPANTPTTDSAKATTEPVPSVPTAEQPAVPTPAGSTSAPESAPSSNPPTDLDAAK
jgi:hypothetical protein